jgi:hypothetical protein
MDKISNGLYKHNLLNKIKILREEVQAVQALNTMIKILSFKITFIN